MRPIIPLLIMSFGLASCTSYGTADQTFNTSLSDVDGWSQPQQVETVQPEALKGWWKQFNDPVLDKLVEMSVSGNPDMLIALSRIEEARGLRRTVRSSLFPSIGASANATRQDSVSGNPDSSYQAGFDVAYEVDLFGRNRNNLNAQDATISALNADARAVQLSLVGEVGRSFILYRAANKNYSIAMKNLGLQQNTLDLVTKRYEFGEAARLDVERAASLVNTTRASLPEFERLSRNAALSLSVLTGKLPEHVDAVLQDGESIPDHDLGVVLTSPVSVLTLRPDIQALTARLNAASFETKSVTADLFPTLSLSGFFGLGDNGLTTPVDVWSLAANAAVSLLDFGAVEGRIDAARAREVQAYQNWRKGVLEAVSEVETALNDTGQIALQRQALTKAYDNAAKSLFLAQDLFDEGEVDFLDVLDAQRNLNSADAALVDAESAFAQAVIRLYKALGVL